MYVKRRLENSFQAIRNMMDDDEEALKESVSNLRSAILLGRTDIIRSILSTAAECKDIDCKLIIVISLMMP